MRCHRPLRLRDFKDEAMNPQYIGRPRHVVARCNESTALTSKILFLLGGSWDLISKVIGCGILIGVRRSSDRPYLVNNPRYVVS